MDFEKGQRVIVRRNLGVKRGLSKEYYYYRGTVEGVPLETQGTIMYKLKEDKIYVKFEGEDNSSVVGWYVHPDEIELVGEGEQARKKELRKGEVVIIARNLGERNGFGEKGFYYGGTISKVPLDSRATIERYDRGGNYYTITALGGRWIVHPDEIELIDPEKEMRKLEERKEFRAREIERLLLQDESVDRIDDKWMGLLKEEAPMDKISESKGKFDPKFNAKDEFIVWVREQFPDLGSHAKSGTEYPELKARVDEVKKAVEVTWKYITSNHRYCHRAYFKKSLEKLNSSFKFEISEQYTIHLENLVRRLEVQSGKKGFPYNDSARRFRELE